MFKRIRINVDGFIGDDGKFHPIRGSGGPGTKQGARYDSVKAGDDMRRKAAAWRRAKKNPRRKKR